MTRSVGNASLVLMALIFRMTTACLAMPLGELVVRCAPHVAPRTALAILSVESGGYPWSINDNDTNYSHRFATREEAEIYVHERLAIDPDASIDIGLAQLNSTNLRGLGLSVDMAFEPCTNVAMGMRILQGAYVRAEARYGPTRRALFEALAAYNGGPQILTTTNIRLRRRVERYANTVWATAKRIPALQPRNRAVSFERGK